ncbi:hypothetical protein DFR50_14322 [Roseiarcus fermentans]|uniref:Uncharacterized protein n=1 Tax=Roseiarcus fermentans TaxID=1473586 RepID=A0A366ENJ3_9HYPH|nr:hypothetical protein DFR50_14322 [Roseiarcus fermentans]
MTSLSERRFCDEDAAREHIEASRYDSALYQYYIFKPFVIIRGVTSISCTGAPAEAGASTVSNLRSRSG